MTTTPFEDSGKTTLTSLEQEAVFVASLLSQYPETISQTMLGASVDGRDIYALRFGTQGAAPLLLVTTIHGDENVPREAALSLARDLCETEHPWGPLLAERELWIVPTPNPDGFPTSRRNANDVDLNRQYLALPSTAPETRILVDLIYELDPVAAMDGHEWNGYESDGVQVSIGTFAANDPQVRAASIATAEAIMSALAPTPTDWYQRDSPVGSINHFLGLLGVVSTLMETTCPWEHVTTGRPDRWAWHRAAMGAWLTHHQAHAADYEAIRTEARARAASKLARHDSVWLIDLQAPVRNDSTTSGVAVSAKGYEIAPDHSATVGPVLDAHGIIWDDQAGTVTLDQERAYLAAFLLDPASEAAIGTTTRIPPDPRVADLPSHELQVWDTAIR